MSALKLTLILLLVTLLLSCQESPYPGNSGSGPRYTSCHETLYCLIRTLVIRSDGAGKELTRLREAYAVYAAMESADSKGTYNVMHSTAVFAFDAKDHARLLISDVVDSDTVVSDLKQLIDQ